MTGGWPDPDQFGRQRRPDAETAVGLAALACVVALVAVVLALLAMAL